MKKILLLLTLALCAPMSFAQSLPSYVPADGLVGYWPFNGNANDMSGNGNNGAVNGATLTTDRNGNANSAYSFDGVNNLIRIPHQNALNLIGDYSISVWYKGNYQNIFNNDWVFIAKRDDNGNCCSPNVPYDVFIPFNSTNYAVPAMAYANGNYTFSTPSNTSPISLDQWQNLIITNTSDLLNFYINGQLIFSENISSTLRAPNTSDLLIGTVNRELGVEWMSGKLDDIAIYNRALSQEEISQLYTATPAPTEVAIGTQTWTTKNLDIATYSDGTIIPQVTDPSEWGNLTTGAWCYYNNDPANGATYGKLYNWYAVAGIHDNDPNTPNKKLAPTGYHVPSDAEWTTLTDFLGGENVAGGKMKATTIWNSPNTYATNSSGFTGLPGGSRGSDGLFYNIRNVSYLSSSSETGELNAWSRDLNHLHGLAGRGNFIKTNGFTVRCVKDTTPNPTASAQSFCGPTTVANLVATGTDLKWYATETGGIALTSDFALASGTYYVTQTLNNLESDRTAVVVTVNEAQISASANTVSSGTAVTLTASDSTTGLSTLPANLQNGLVGYWPFNGDANDASGNGNNGTVNGATLTNDRFGNSNGAYSFDGINNYIIANNTPNILTSNYSVSIWFNSPISLCNNNIMLRSGNAYNCGWQGFAIGNNTYQTNFGLSDFGNNNYAFVSNYNCDNVLLNEWHNLVYTRENLYSKEYIDGILVNSNSSSYYNVASNCPLFFGSNHLDQNNNSWSVFSGKLDDIAIYNRALTSQEIQQLYTQGQPTYSWSTGETTATINPSPTTTTTYWCDVTANGVTCRKELTVTVRPLAPTATAQTFCASATVNSLVATGTDVKWYTAETGGTALASDVTLVSGTYYVSQTLNTVESDRTAVEVTINEAQISASANSVSSGTAVELKINQQNISSPNYSLYHQAGGYFADSNNDNYVVFPVSSTLNTNYSSWTMECWAKIMSPSEEGILSIGNPEHGGGNAIYSGWSNVFGAYSNSNEGGAGAVSSYNYTPAVWNHFALSYQNGTYRLFLNGILKESWVSGSSVVINNMYPFMTNTHWWWRGGDLSSHRMTVYYDDIRVSKVCRYTSDFIPNTNWNNDTNTIGLWNFNEGSGNTVLDYSGNLNNGIIHGATYSSDVPETSVNNVNLSNSYLWSTGETTASINPSPTATTTYWCDVTVNGVTCRKEMTITVTAKLEVISPINYCHKSTAVPLTATPTTGSTLKWYTTTTSKTASATAPTPMTTPVGSKTYYVAERNAAGVESERLPIVVNINPLPTTPNAIQLTEGSNSITKVGPYIGTTTPLTLSISAANATSFDWILPKGVLVTSAVNSSTTDADGVTTANASGSITINFSGVTAGLGTLFISVKSVGNCGTSAERKIALTRVILSTPGTISTTNSNVCFGIVGTANKVTYSIAPVAGAFAQGYTWTVPTGATIETPVANVLTMTYGTEIEVSYDSSFVSGAVSVKASNGVGMSKIKTLSVVRRVPFNIASITGPVTFCANKTATISVPSVAGVTYSWSATNNTNLTAQGNSVTASFANTSSISAYTSVTVTQNNGCGYGASKKITLSRGSCATTKIASQDKTSSQLFTAMAYPNPSSTAFEVTTNTEKAFGVKVYDLLGRLIEEQHTKGATLKIGANYQSGTYILKVSQGENQKTLQVIKK